MPPTPPSNPPSLLKTILEPLLADFQYWFERSRTLLESERLHILSTEQQSALLERVMIAQREVIAAQLLFQATNAQVGVAMAQVATWHRLVGECWQVSSCWRAARDTSAREFD
ncbi:MAG: DUF2605 domain-containing protein [Spirulinaceae cyanobacterium SM2_1_0]|nr:DUF2605 domain-containing protein [Spirulinaceae cyanobacterium SM2_1_0]